MIILDLKLPGMSGFELLTWIREQRRFKTLPIVVLSGSSLAEDRQKAEQLGATGYVVKDSNYAETATQILSLAGTFSDTRVCL